MTINMDMTRQEIEEKVAAIIVDRMCVGPEEVVDDARLKEDLDMDSLDNIDLVIKLEDAFSVSFTDRETDSMDTWTVKDVYDRVESKL